MNISIIITTYNRPDAILAVLRSLNLQYSNNFHVVIADDGSTADTKTEIEAFQDSLNFPITYTWQEDSGFRAAQIRNKAVANSSGDYLIFLDGDCLPYPDFISNHEKLAEVGYFVRGSRIMLRRNYTNKLLSSNIQTSDVTFFELVKLRMTNEVNGIFSYIKLPLKSLRKYKNKNWYGVKTCNLGVWRKDFLEVNGFDEHYQGWGHEDADLAIRLIKNGIYRKEGVNAVAVLHLWHELNDRSKESENLIRLREVQQSNCIRANLGVSQYL